MINSIRTAVFLIAFLFLICKATHAVPINEFINNVSPAQNEINVNKSITIVIHFVQFMDFFAIDSTNLLVYGSQTGNIECIISHSEISKKTFINPVNDFKAGELITVVLTSDIHTLTNTSITPFTFIFRVGATSGSATFLDPYFPSSGSRFAKFIIPGDFDNDNDLDLCIANDSNKITILKNNGAGNFGDTSNFILLPKKEISSLISGDFDNDGDIDLAASVFESGILTSDLLICKNNGSGIFSLSTTNIGFGGNKINAGDFDSDGDLDIVRYKFKHEMTILLNNGSGDFIFNADYNFSCGCNFDEIIAGFSVNDFDNDGDLDIVVEGFQLFSCFCNITILFRNNGAAIFSRNDILPPNGSFFFLSDDFNGDRYMDFIEDNGKIYTNNGGSGSFSITTLPLSFGNILSNDYDADGDEDVSEKINSPGKLKIFKNNGTGSFALYFSKPVVFADPPFDFAYASGDFDSDGDIDLTASGNAIGKISIFLNSDFPLPVELASFTSVIIKRDITLYWQTESEENNYGFDIERSEFNFQLNIFSDQWNNPGFVIGNGTSSSPANYEFTDKNLSSGKYRYRLKQIDFNGNFKYYGLQNEVIIGIPNKFSLSQNFPNPFNPTTKINFDLPEDGNVKIKIFDNSGKEIDVILNEFKQAGYYTQEFNAANLSSGVYYYRLESGNFAETKKMLLLK